MPTARMQPFRNDWNRVYVPGRGLAYSFIVHEIAIFLALSYAFLAPPTIVVKTPEEAILSSEVLYLPEIGGGDSGGQEGKAGQEGEGQSHSSSPAKGVTYRGAQFIKSSPPNPDNALQTILQPTLVNPPKLALPLQVPSMVHVAKAPDVKPPSVKVRLTMKDVPITADASKPVLKLEMQPEVISTPLKSQIEPLLPLPVQPAAASNPAPAKPMVVTAEERVTPPTVLAAKAQTSDHSIAVLNAIQVNVQPRPIPAGEKHGSFEVSPNGSGTAPNLKASAGLPTGTSNESSASGSGTAHTATGAGTGNGSGTGNSGTGSGARASGSGIGKNGMGPGGGGKGIGSAAKSGGPGTGTRGGHGNGIGSGNGSGTGTGSGAGNGPGDGAFPGIEVIGGVGSGLTGVDPKSVPVSRPKPPGNYDLSIVASGGSGGGLKDFGIFRNEAVYTVYVDVSDVAPGSRSFILQYALYSSPRTSEITLGGGDSSQAPEAMLEPPYAITKEVPTPGARNSMVVVSGVITRQGKFESARVLQAPSPEEGRRWTATLANWVFKPASRGGIPVTLKVVLGIPN